jgi:hypothetical protein
VILAIVKKIFLTGIDSNIPVSHIPPIPQRHMSLHIGRTAMNDSKMKERLEALYASNSWLPEVADLVIRAAFETAAREVARVAK